MMQKLVIEADQDLIREVEQIAKWRRVSPSVIARELLAKELRSYGPQPVPKSIGAFRSETGDLSRRASEDEYEPPPWR